MRTIPKLLREGALILVTGITLATFGVYAWNSLHHPTLEAFRSEYLRTPYKGQEAIAKRFLAWYTPHELLASIQGGAADGVCHVEAHAIGRAIYAQNRNFSDSLKQCGNSCTFGCFHGVMMGVFATDSDTLGGSVEAESPAEYLASIRDSAVDLCSRPEVQGTVHARSCVHGLGHVFVSGTGDIAASLESCKTLKDIEAVNACAAGVFMEYLFDSSHSAVMLKKGPAPCDSYPSFTASCYQYKAYGWLLAYEDPHAALVACDALGTNARICIRSTGRAAATEHVVEGGGEVDGLCGFLPREKRDECMSGAYMKALDLYDADDVDRVCDRVDTVHRSHCDRALKQFRELYGKYL